MPDQRDSGADLFRRVFDLDNGVGKPGDDRDERPVVRLCNLILSEGLLNKASEVRLAEYEADCGSVEYLIAGEWRQVMKVPVQAHRPIVNRLKVMAGLDIARVPEQRGAVHVTFQGQLHIFAITVQALPAGSDVALLRLEPAAPDTVL